MEKTVNLIYGGNDEDYEGILFSILSAMRRTKRPLSVTLMTALIDDPSGKPVERAKANYLRALLRAREDGSDLRLTDMTQPLSSLLKKIRRLYDPYALLALLIERSDLTGRQLYLAPRTLFSGDVSAVFDYPLNGCAAGAVRDAVNSFLFDPDDVNAGVLLIDMERARKERLFENARKAIFEKPGVSVGYALKNAGAPLCFLPKAFNEQGGLRRDTVIRQYCRKLRILPYPHIRQGSAQSGYGMSGREYRIFERVYEEYLLQREGRKVK